MAKLGNAPKSAIFCLVLAIATPCFTLAAFAGTPTCPRAELACSVQLAQADMYPPPVMQAQPMMGQPTMMGQPEQQNGRSIFLAMFAQTFAPSVANAIGTWFQNKLNGPSPSAQGSLQGNAYATGNPSGGQFGQGFGGMPPQMQPQMPQQMSPQFPSTMSQQVMPQMPMQNYGGMPGQMPAEVPPQVMPPPVMPVAAAVPMDGRAVQDLPLQAGIAFQVSLVGRDGTRMLVDPVQRKFNTGEQIEVAYRTNLPGVVDVFSIDSRGKEELIEQKMVAPAQLTVLGPYEFVNAKGEEILRLRLRPCVSAAGPATRGLVLQQINPKIAGNLASCDDPTQSQQRLATRGIAKVMVEGATSFALDTVADTEVASGKLAPREVRIRFVHL